jgi:hypothetical protein
MGGLGSGKWRKRRRTVESCPVLDANRLSVKGCLRPGWSGTCPLVLGNAVIPIDLWTLAKDSGQYPNAVKGLDQ